MQPSDRQSGRHSSSDPYFAGNALWGGSELIRALRGRMDISDITQSFSRRGFLAASTAFAAAGSLSGTGLGQSALRGFLATTRVFDINGRAATAFGLVNWSGGRG